MSRRAAAALVAAALLLALAGLLWLKTRRRAPPPATTAVSAPAEELAAEAETRLATLWLPAAGGRLAARDIEVTSAPALRPRLAALLAALLAAAPDEETAALFPAPVQVAALLLGPDGTLYVDLRAADGGPPPGAGSTHETQRVYSVVHTVLRNEPRVAGVVLLWNGEQRESLAGHVDTRRPLLLRPELEAR